MDRTYTNNQYKVLDCVGKILPTVEKQRLDYSGRDNI